MSPSPSYEKGRKAENECVRHMKMAGYAAIRSAGSHGPWDVTAVGPLNVKLISVTTMYDQPDEIEQRRNELRHVPAPILVQKELWVKIPYRGWQIEVLDAES